MTDLQSSDTEALALLGSDFTFQHAIEGAPKNLSDFKGLRIGSFKTSDGVRLAYWEAGAGKPLIFIPGWSSNGAEHFYLLHLLARDYHVYVLDVRNQGLSDRVQFGNRIARYATDVKEFIDHLDVESASLCGWSMGAATIWAYIDLFETSRINKVAFIDQAPSIYCHADWSEQERLEAGAFTSSPERMIASYTTMTPTNSLVSATRVLERAMLGDSPYFQNAMALSQAFVQNDMRFTSLVLFDHTTNDWRDVIRYKINVPTAIFTGVHSDWLASQRWMESVIPDAVLHVYSDEEHGDHFLSLKNPVKFAADLHSFLER
ncbi:alpha/beta fold hydrolase [Burkholderia multivorans]|uniref:alpha/beta fold hydrolase n=1 Tax=Burkholderia multivorans TaxID=87883 RepID=UPI00158E0E76|nr:alpha/beta hydrolase [Burkholderia multivorans]